MTQEDEHSVEYWKCKSEELEGKYSELQEEYKTLEATGKEVESELEDFIRVLEEQNGKLKTENTQSASDLEKLRQRYAEIQKENNELMNIRDRQEMKINELANRVRALENENDTLSQSERRANYTIETLRDELESHLLRLCSLEEEVIQKDQLSEALQRMKDEFRDMEQEMRLQKQKASAAGSLNLLNSNSSGVHVGTSISNVSSPVNASHNSLTSQRLLAHQQMNGTHPQGTTAVKSETHVESDVVDSNANSIHTTDSSSIANNNNTIENGVKYESVDGAVAENQSVPHSNRSTPVNVKKEPSSPNQSFNTGRSAAISGRSGNLNTGALNSNVIYSGNDKGDLGQQQAQPPTAKVHPIKKSMNQTHHHHSQQSHPNMAMRHSSRTQALQIVSDLLRKVSNLESKLESCRMYSASNQLVANGTTTATNTTSNGMPTIASENLSQRDAVSEFVHSTEAASFTDQIRYY